jgi:cell division protein FtsI (penicillin-binding protein 3)
MLEAAVSGERATGKAAQLPGVRVAGKTGTSDDAGAVQASFVGWLPAEAPRFIVYVGIQSAAAEATGAHAAAPAFARLGQQLLAN